MSLRCVVSEVGCVREKRQSVPISIRLSILLDRASVHSSFKTKCLLCICQFGSSRFARQQDSFQLNCWLNDCFIIALSKFRSWLARQPTFQRLQNRFTLFFPKQFAVGWFPLFRKEAGRSLWPRLNAGTVLPSACCHGVMPTCCLAVIWTPAEGQQVTTRGEQEDKKRTTGGQEDNKRRGGQEEEKTKDKKRTTGGQRLETGWQPRPSWCSQEDSRRTRRGQQEDNAQTKRNQRVQCEKTTAHAQALCGT